MTPKPKLFLTGASGLLGRAIYSKFEDAGWDIYGIAFSRVENKLYKLDITDKTAVRKTIQEYQPDIVIHAAAQRFPDKVESDPEAARVLNIDATGYIVDAAAEIKVPVIYISTDYVFDGNKGQPYTIADDPKPINLYGQTKLEGEKLTLKQSGNIVLRVPVLYGPVLALKESAVTCLLETLTKKTDAASVSNLERRCPSHVNDISTICFQLSNSRLKDESISGVFQWCGEEKMTKYDMVIRMAEIFNLPHSHIQPDIKVAANTSRPLDTQLDVSRLRNLGFGKHTPFNKGIFEVLHPWIKGGNP